MCALCRWMTVSADHIVILILLLALTVKFIFFEDKAQLAEQLRMSDQMDCLDGQEYCHGHSHSQLNNSLRKKFSANMPFVRTSSFFLERSDSFEADGKHNKIQFLDVYHLLQNNLYYTIAIIVNNFQRKNILKLLS